VEMRRETSRVSFLMCPFCVRGSLSVFTTESVYGAARGIPVGVCFDRLVTTGLALRIAPAPDDGIQAAGRNVSDGLRLL
jgi:hypothetical protein